MNMLAKKYIIMLIVAVLLVIWFFPKPLDDCRGTYTCFGYVHIYSEDGGWLNIATSTLTIKSEEKISCIGPKAQYTKIMDGCSGDWGWYVEMPIDCTQKLRICREPSQIISGIICSEWTRTCEELNHTNKVSI